MKQNPGLDEATDEATNVAFFIALCLLFAVYQADGMLSIILVVAAAGKSCLFVEGYFW
ncbi:MAG: hypothetical protein KGZ45_00350 [Clostridium sp.]|nr:hypothetical protein [Clostridium sp.]